MPFGPGREVGWSRMPADRGRFILEWNTVVPAPRFRHSSPHYLGAPAPPREPASPRRSAILTGSNAGAAGTLLCGPGNALRGSELLSGLGRRPRAAGRTRWAS